ncbi:flagellar hook-basal body complex protein [Desulfotomaculum sp. 1211_IL3151]|uniref:flagellar hook-basal body complex protein n=1 Tax=Desulfotomaculum sp. 1211_IL3151 TaxID=3084055 RepID=UPI002FDA9BB1
MLRSLYSGISGMRNHQTRMDVTGNNIANVNTTGYKSGRVNFQDTLSQTVRSGGDSTNPAQVGLGMAVGSVSNNFTQGPMQSSGRTLDLAIQGNGFFVVSDGTNDFYTREGIFFVDKQGYMVNSDGLRVQSMTHQDIQVLNGPVSTINIGPDGAITGTNTAGQPLKFSNNDNQAIVIPATQASIKGAPKYTSPKVEEAVIKGIAINPVAQPLKEAMIRGNSSSPHVAPLGIDGQAIDMSDSAEYGFTLEYSDGLTPIGPVTLNTGLTNVKSWYDLAAQLQKAIDGSALKDKVVVSYDSSPNGGLVFQTKTSEMTISGTTPTKFVKPSITIGGDGFGKYMGSLEAGVTPPITNIGTEVVPKDWTGKTFYIDTGHGWEEVTTVDDFSKIGGAAGPTGLDQVTSGKDLADKIQKLLDTRMTVSGSVPNVKVEWNIDHLEFSTVGTPNDGVTIPQIRIRGDGAVDLVGYTDKTEKGSNSADWSNKDFFIEYNGTKYTFTAGEKKEAGFANIINGDSLKAALAKLIDKKIGENKIKVEYTNEGKLLLQTLDNGVIGETPEINIGGADAGDLMGDKPDKVSGTAASVTPPEQEKEGIIKLVTFQNPEGLEKAGRNLFNTSTSSGEPKAGQANQSGFGTINSNYLEMSNVDLTEEFTNMITTQRGYQANARVITVSDSLLEELIQLKR